MHIRARRDQAWAPLQAWLSQTASHTCQNQQPLQMLPRSSQLPNHVDYQKGPGSSKRVRMSPRSFRTITSRPHRPRRGTGGTGGTGTGRSQQVHHHGGDGRVGHRQARREALDLAEPRLPVPPIGRAMRDARGGGGGARWTKQPRSKGFIQSDRKGCGSFRPVELDVKNR